MKALQASLALAAIGAVSFGIGYGLGRDQPPGEELPVAVAVEELQAGRSLGSLLAPIDEAAFTEKIEAATQSASGLAQSAAMAEILPGMQAHDFERLAPVLEASFGIGSAALPAQLYVERWAQLDPAGAHERVAGWPADRRREAMPGLLRAWARSDPEAALATLAALEDRRLRQISRRGLIQGWAETGDPEIWAYVARLARARARREAMIIVMQQVATQRGPDALLDEVAERTRASGDDDFRDEAMGLAADVLARADLEHAIAEAETCSQAPWCDEVTAAVAVRWASRDGRAASEWTRRLSAGAAGEGALYAAYSTWLRRDPEAAMQWLDDQEMAADLGPAHSARGRIMAQQSLPDAVRWAEGVETPEMRREAQIAVGRVYRRKDPAGAERWLGALGLSGEVPVREKRNAATE